jgi:hypothetical protein
MVSCCSYDCAPPDARLVPYKGDRRAGAVLDASIKGQHRAARSWIVSYGARFVVDRRMTLSSFRSCAETRRGAYGSLVRSERRATSEPGESQ